MKNVTGIFDNKILADRAVAELLDRGFSKDDITLLMSEQTRNKLFGSTDDEANRVAKGGIAGASIGVVMGALIAGLTTVGIIVVPGSGLLVAGPMVAILSGAGAGAVTGGLAGALIRAGFAADEANRYEEEIKNGKAIVIVHVSDENKIPVAQSALQNLNATTKVA